MGRSEEAGGEELTARQRMSINSIELLLICGLVESDGNPVDGAETYRWTRDADNFRMVLDLGEE